MWAEYLASAIKGMISLRGLCAETTGLMRYLCDSPRKRRRRAIQQLPTLAAAMSLLS